MKKTLFTVIITALMSASLFGLALPNGSNVRAASVEQDGEAIVKVTINNPVTTATPLGDMKVKSEICFYKSGALKSVIPAAESEDEKTVEVKVGDISLKFRDDYWSEAGKIYFYESGSLMKAEHLNGKSSLKIGDNTLTTTTREIIFHDTGKADCVVPKSIYFDSCTITAGGIKFKDCTEVKYNAKGDILAVNASLDNPDEEFVTGLGSLYATTNKAWFNFYASGKIRSFKNGEVIMPTLAGSKVSINEGETLEFYEDGKIKYVGKTSAPIKFKKGTTEYTADTYIKFDESGNVIGADDMYVFGARYQLCGSVDGFYDNGTPKLVTGAKKLEKEYWGDGYFIDTFNTGKSSYPISFTRSGNSFATPFAYGDWYGKKEYGYVVQVSMKADSSSKSIAIPYINENGLSSGLDSWTNYYSSAFVYPLQEEDKNFDYLISDITYNKDWDLDSYVIYKHLSAEESSVLYDPNAYGRDISNIFVTDDNGDWVTETKKLGKAKKYVAN